MPDGAIASPLTLLLEEGDASGKAREILSLSYTVNLGFWERYALGVARGLGARVTLVGEAKMVSADVGYTRYAGLTYLDGRAACRGGGAFHPKLFVVAGDDYATVAVGSGNVTVPGWHANREIWTVLRGDAEGAPATFRQLADWLRRLPDAVAFSAGVEDALERVCERLDGLPADDGGPTLVSSLQGSIVEQLPSVQADELVLTAPFHGRDNRALRELIARLRPTEVRVLLQPGATVVDGPALAGVLRQHGGSALSLAESRYCHGKLYEWRVGKRRYALSGSPNATAAALLEGMGEGGNCELALLSEVDASVAPATGDRLDGALARLPYDERAAEDEVRPAGVMLGVSLATGRLVIRLVSPLAEEAVLEYAAGDVWQPAARVPPGSSEIEIEYFLGPGIAVRLALATGESNVCFVTDTKRVLRTPVEHAGRVRTDPTGVFTDARLAELFVLDLGELRALLPDARGAGRDGGDSKPPPPPTYTSFEEYLDRCAARVGEELLAWGLALPSLGDHAAPVPQEERPGHLEGDDPTRRRWTSRRLRVPASRARRAPKGAGTRSGAPASPT